MSPLARLACGGAVAALLLVPAAPVGAQSSEVFLEMGASSILPPTGVDGDAATFAMAGLRAVRFGAGGSDLYASLLAGWSTDAASGSDFLAGEAGARAWHAVGSGWSLGVEARAQAFGVRDPFPYRALAAEGGALVRYRDRVLDVRLAATGGAGRSRVTLTEAVQRMRRRSTVTQVLEDDLWRWGGTAEVMAGGRGVSAGLAGGVHRSAGGTYRSAGVRLLAGGAGGALEVRGDVWSTPDGRRTTGGLTFYVPWRGWTARGTVGRPEPDPLVLAEPGRRSSGILVGRRVLGEGPLSLRRPEPLHQVLAPGAGGARVRFALPAPAGASMVEVLGDFTLWEPLPMTERGSLWTLEVDVPAGTHHFGFLVDGEWYLPKDAPDAVPDEWGRRSATLVIEGDVP